MKLHSLLCTALLGISLFSSCKKDDNNNTNTGGSGNLPTGKAAVTFNTSANFGGSTTFNPSNPAQSVAARNSSGVGYDNITLTVTDINTSTFASRTAQFVILINKTLTGAQTANFSNTASNSIYPVLTISSTNGGSVGDAYTSESGTVSITKLSDTEIEGTFSGKLVNDNSGTSINVTNGTFAGKFK